MEQATIHTPGGRRQEQPVFGAPLRTVAMVLSYILHPLFIPFIVTFLLVHAVPEYFVTFKQFSARFPYDKLYFRVITITVFFPLLTVLLARAVHFVGSLHLHTQRDRIIPYIASTIYFFWAYYAFRREGVVPSFYSAFFLGVFIAIVISMIANTYTKISMHTVGWGGVIGFLLALMWYMNMNVSFPLMATFLVAGLVATARMVLSAHTPAEIYAGFLVGIISQLIAFAIVV